MARKYTSNSKGSATKQSRLDNTRPNAEFIQSDVQAYPSPLKGWLGIVAAIGFILILTLAGSMDNIIEKWTGWLAAIIIVLLLLVSKQSQKLKNYITPLFFSFSAYIMWGGISTFYAASGKFAIFEFSKLLVALCIYLVVLFFTDPNEIGFKRISYAVASTGCFFGVISVDAASSKVLSGVFKSFLGLFTDVYASRGGFEEGIRITGIFGNPNIYAGFMAIAVFLSLYLKVSASDKKNARIASGLLAINSLAYLLAFSLGSLFMFLISCLIMIGVSEKGKRVSLFLLMLETAILSLIFAGLSMAGLGKTGIVSFLPIIALILNALALYLIDERLRAFLDKKINGNIRLLLIAILVILILILGYIIAAFQVSSEIKLGINESVMRAIYVPEGEYNLNIESSIPVTINVESQNKNDLMRHTSVGLYSGTNENAIHFTVPADSEIVQVHFISSENTTITKANYTGTQIGDIHLNYPLLPNIIANRIQNLFANENAVQRTVFFEDGIKLFSKSPIIGRGLGGFENGVYSVQNFFYETKYAHNHYIQVLSDLGIVGLIIYLCILVFSILALIQAKKRARSLYAIPLLSACIFQMFGQAVTDATWSTGVFLGFAATILALITIFCAEPIKTKVAVSRIRIAEKIALCIFTGIFILLLSGNLYAQAHARAGVRDFKDIDRLILLDRFERNDYKVSYIINAPKSGSDDVMKQADKYAEELIKEESNSIAPYVMTYNFDTYKDLDAFSAAKRGLKNAASYPYMWTKIFDICEEYIDPVSAHTDDAADRLKDPKYYIENVLELYDALIERNSNSLDKIALSPYNNAFIGKLLEIKATNQYSIDWVFTAIMSYAFDSECAVDTDQNGIPDSISVKSGSISRNQDGLLSVSKGTVLDLSLYHKLHGSYTFKVKTDTPQGIKINLNGEDMETAYTEDEAFTVIDLADNSERKLSNFTVTFPQAVVIDEITYITELQF